MVNLLPKIIEILKVLVSKHGLEVPITSIQEMFAERLGILNLSTLHKKMVFLTGIGYIKYEKFWDHVILTDKVIEKMKALEKEPEDKLPINNN